MSNKKLWLVNDLVISEENCNMTCTYCLTDASEFKVKHLNHPLRNPPVKLTYDGKFKQQIDQVTEETVNNFDISILKVSGGEVMLIDKVLEFLKRESPKYKVLQILTNGMNLNERILDEFKKMGNVVMQISIDHHTLEGNSHRFSSQRLQDILLNRIDLVVKKGIPLELYCVLNNKSTAVLDSFLDYLLKYKDDDLTVCPFPVRGPLKDLYYPEKEQIQTVEKVINNFQKYKYILPPLPYMERLYNFLIEGERTFGCYLSRMVFGSFNDGSVTACPNIWFNHLGNLIHDEPKRVLNKVENTRFYSLLNASKPRLEACKSCYTPWDLLSLYVEDQITIDELAESPMYRNNDVRDRLVELKNKIKKGPIKIKEELCENI
ncbi:radical SAM protein [Cytobacillus kochii]|uniref:radical SAM protein n=1 Tax=Cytobacillus kochii TaxID=859143 RepID=UPI001CD7153A|nr:radical SAM protein [Cytobacillus kochii]MCA1028633.1 radical SAM protein [Cytobacillus kochii]